MGFDEHEVTIEREMGIKRVILLEIEVVGHAIILNTKRLCHPSHIHLNLLTITARINITSTVMIAIVISRFVAILSHYQYSSKKHSVHKSLPTRHPPQCLDTPISVPFALTQHIPSMLNSFSLPSQVSKRIPSDFLSVISLA